MSPKRTLHYSLRLLGTKWQRSHWIFANFKLTSIFNKPDEKSCEKLLFNFYYFLPSLLIARARGVSSPCVPFNIRLLGARGVSSPRVPFNLLILCARGVSSPCVSFNLLLPGARGVSSPRIPFNLLLLSNRALRWDPGSDFGQCQRGPVATRPLLLRTVNVKERRFTAIINLSSSLLFRRLRSWSVSMKQAVFFPPCFKNK